ncbi:MAG: hypothetical protein N2V77_07370 [Canidatus Methanoxibalbensis ujae]|nr:hypothetical protein [Candidatus Methanoxibalbensis ujae]MCW7078066.1 hypothetical protein [Candidatus Methanoxibalbensis ujae]
MNDMRPKVRVIRDVGYRVLMRDSDGAPRQVLRGFVKEGDYGKFLSIETHWVQQMDGDRIVESRWARKTINFPYDRERAMSLLNSIRELVEECFVEDLTDDLYDEGTDLEKEIATETGRRQWNRGASEGEGGREGRTLNFEY